MSARVSVRVVAEQEETTVAVKTATTPAGIQQLADEAERLRTTTHPGLVTYVDHRVLPDRAELHTLYAGPSLERWQGTLPEVAGLVAALATTVADLHDLGIVHGRIERSHILLGAGGRPLLCSLAPAPPDAGPPADLASLGRLLDDLLSGTGQRRRPLPGRRLAGSGRRRLDQLIDRAADPVASRRPTARALATGILRAVPAAHLPHAHGTPAAGEPPADRFAQVFVDQRDTGEHEVFSDRPWQPAGPGRPPREPGRARHRPPGRAVAAAALAILGLLGAGGWYVQDRGGAGELAPPPVEVATPDCPRPPRPPDSEGGRTLVADITGDGCTEPVVITAAGTVITSRARWAVGEPGDAITLGDWNCDGRATPAALRVTSGEVFVFRRWAEDGDPLTVTPVARIPGGVRLADPADVPAGGRCDVPTVELSSGDLRPVEAGA